MKAHRNPSRWVSRLLLTAPLCLGVLGCKSLHEQLRPHVEHSEGDDASRPLGDEVRDIKSPEKAPFFKPSRLSGAMSDEGREIERDLGIR